MDRRSRPTFKKQRSYRITNAGSSIRSLLHSGHREGWLIGSSKPSKPQSRHSGGATSSSASPSTDRETCSTWSYTTASAAKTSPRGRSQSLALAEGVGDTLAGRLHGPDSTAIYKTSPAEPTAITDSLVRFQRQHHERGGVLGRGRLDRRLAVEPDNLPASTACISPSSRTSNAPVARGTTPSGRGGCARERSGRRPATVGPSSARARERRRVRLAVEIREPDLLRA